MKTSTFVRTVLSCCLLALFSACEDNGGRDFGDNNPNLYVAVGDSITRGYGSSTSWPSELSALLGKDVVNRGVDGAMTSDGITMTSRALGQYKPGYLLIYLGANDVIHVLDNGGTIERLRTIINAAQDNKTVPVIATITPMTRDHEVFDGSAADLSARIISLAAEEDVSVVDLRSRFIGHSEWMQSDGLHPNDEGLRQVALAFLDEL